MPYRETAADRGARRGRFLNNRIARDLADTRRASGLSRREVADRLSVSHGRVGRAERGDPATLTIEFTARMAAVLGLELGVGLHADGDPVRDKGHLALLERFRGRLSSEVRWRTEVPMPIEGDRRTADGVVDGPDLRILVEAETHLDDVQALERSIAGKQRDLGIDRVILLVSDTRHNRAVIRRTEELRRRFPVRTRASLAALSQGHDPGGDCLVVL